MKIRSFEFTLRELAGSFGDFGTLFPLAIGYIAVCGLDPAGFLVLMGLANIATSALIKKYWPDRPVSENRLALNQGVMNVVLPFFGGMPLCHGAGGVAGQYYFGARTGGTNLLEGLLEVSLGLFLAGSIAALFAAFPSAIIGAMMLLVGVEMVKFARDVRWSLDLLPLAAALGTSPEFWLNAQQAVDVYRARKRVGRVPEPIAEAG